MAQCGQCHCVLLYGLDSHFLTIIILLRTTSGTCFSSVHCPAPTTPSMIHDFPALVTDHAHRMVFKQVPVQGVVLKVRVE
eukprot:325391-Amphidinium_carterae.1